MAEIKKDSTVLDWGKGLDAAKAAGKTSVNDFTGSSDFVQLKAGDSVQLKNAVWKENGSISFPVFECYKGTKFVGYISFRKLQGLRYDGLNPYCTGTDSLSLANLFLCQKIKLQKNFLILYY